MRQRTQRIADLLRAELSLLLQREVHDPRVRLASVSRVEVASDLSRARVLISALGEPDARDAVIAGLESARGFLRRELARRLSLRRTPELHFVLDRGAEHSLQMSELLDGLAGERDDGS